MLNGFGDAAQIDIVRVELAQQYGVQVLYDAVDLSRGEAVRSLVGHHRQYIGPHRYPGQ